MQCTSVIIIIAILFQAARAESCLHKAHKPWPPASPQDTRAGLGLSQWDGCTPPLSVETF